MSLPDLTKRERFLRAARGQEVDRPPVWIMRQAGRYMPEYMALRQRYTFKDLCHDAEACTAVSLLPRDLLDVDSLIIFNDILIPLEEMGLRVDFPDEGGPRITNPPRDEAALDHFRPRTEGDPPVCRNLRLLRAEAGEDTAILGFAGAPFTLLGYAVEGKMTRNNEHLKELIFRQPNLAHEMLARLSETVTFYLVAQVQEGGADAVQMFESLGAILSPADRGEFALPYQQRVIRNFKAACPETPLIIFSRGGGDALEMQARSGADILSVEWMLTLAEARSRTDKPLQGNLDPMVLTVPEAVERHAEKMLEGFDWKRGYIANLGHGITPQAKVEGAQRFVRYIQGLK